MSAKKSPLAVGIDFFKTLLGLTKLQDTQEKKKKDGPLILSCGIACSAHTTNLCQTADQHPSKASKSCKGLLFPFPKVPGSSYQSAVVQPHSCWILLSFGIKISFNILMKYVSSPKLVTGGKQCFSTPLRGC